jgi:hypothetical protein
VTPQRRLTIAGLAMIVGGMVVAVGVRITWATATLSASPVETPGLPRIVLAGGRITFSGSEVGAGYLAGLGLLIALIPLVWLVAGPTGRLILAVAGLGLAVAVVVGVAVARDELPARAERLVREETAGFSVGGRISTGPGITVTLAGAAVGGLGALFGGIAGRHVPRLRMPERPDRGDPT